MNENTIAEKLNSATSKLFEAGIDTARLDAEVLLSYVLNCRRLALYVNVKKALTDEQISRYDALIARRLEHIPVAYLIGYKEFMGMKFAVTPEVLIPRPDTEILVQGVIERLLNFKGDFRLADICTGSGAIGISILKFIEHITAEAVDISKDAISMAKFNAKKFNVDNRINFHVGNLFEPLAGQKFNVIVSNPPYIPTGDFQTLQAEVKNEPKVALDGGADGLDFYGKIFSQAADFLFDEGFVAVEVGGNDSAAAVQKIIEETGNFGEIQIWKDLANINRVVVAWKK